MSKIRKGDFVQIIKGKDKGKKGKVISIMDKGKRAIIEGLNLAKKHKRQTRQDEKGGIVQIEAPVAIGNVMFICKSCDKPVRVGFSILKDGSKTRICKICKEAV
ncbi:MAG: 50S ribosomal protein L24 [Candidatus Omnitrophica bacterium]|nr:50S ribosomal protein L24 [Candidatus Omnitrophota bacterium]